MSYRTRTRLTAAMIVVAFLAFCVWAVASDAKTSNPHPTRPAHHQVHHRGTGGLMYPSWCDTRPAALSGGACAP